MDFELTQDQLDLQRTIRDILDKESPPSLARSLVAADTDSFWATLVGLDWPALALPEEVGGLGLGWIEQAILLEELGRHTSPGPYLATVTEFAAAVAQVGTADDQQRFLAPVAAGEITGTLAIDEGLGTWDPATVEASAQLDAGEIVLSGTKRFVVDGATADEIAVVVILDGTVRVVVVPGAAVEAEAIEPIDAGILHAAVSLDGVRVSADRLIGEGDAGPGLTRALEEATVAVAAMTLGASEKIFEMVNEYAKERIQFGVPIGSFQAVKHKLADMFRDVERARALVYYAALTLAEDHPDRAMAASMAKAGAGEAQQRCAQDGLQLLGGIGYTWEHDFHLLLRRAKVGELHFGSSALHRRRVARLSIAAASAPSA